MKRRLGAAVMAINLFLPTTVFCEAPNKKTDPPGQNTFTLTDYTQKKFTGDLDGMIERRLIRILVTHSKTNYFVDRGTQLGLVYEAFRLFEDELKKKLKKKHIGVNVVFIPVARDQLIPALIEGRGDIAAANLTITPERLKKVDFSEPTGRNVSEIVVTASGVKPLSTVQELAGREVYIRKSSSFYESLELLNAKLSKEGRALVKVRLAPEVLENEDILEMVNAGLVKITIVDNHIARFWKQVLSRIVLYPEIAVRTSADIGWMIRKNSPKLKTELNAFIARHPEGSKTRNVLLQKYLKNISFAKEATSKQEIAKFDAVIKLFQKYGGQYEMDYLMMMAQGYQESRLDHNTRSPVGAIGIMQVMPATGKELKVGDITKIEPNIHAGVKYIRFMMNQYFANEPMDPLDKGLLTFASYNAGPGRVEQLRKEAAKRGLDPNKWFNNVEIIAAEKIGRETVQYVSNIYKYYLAYRMVMETRQEREKVKEDAKKKLGS
jgi:membrane-bound lytic murein transglycosylase MltF